MDPRALCRRRAGPRSVSAWFRLVLAPLVFRKVRGDLSLQALARRVPVIMASLVLAQSARCSAGSPRGRAAKRLPAGSRQRPWVGWCCGGRTPPPPCSCLCTLALERSQLNVVDQHVTRPVVLDSSSDVVIAKRRVLHLVEQRAEVETRAACAAAAAQMPGRATPPPSGACIRARRPRGGESHRGTQPRGEEQRAWRRRLRRRGG